MRSALLAIPVLAAVCAAAFLAAGAPGRSHDAPGRTLAIAERDFRIAAPARAQAGHVTLRVHNVGPDSHELIVVRTDRAGLPLRSDRLTVDEEAVEHDTAGALEPGEPGGTRTLVVDLKPGRYELICNMSGHYLGGMHTTLEVR